MRPAYLIQSIQPAAFVRPAGQTLFGDYTNPIIATADTGLMGVGAIQAPNKSILQSQQYGTYGNPNVLSQIPSKAPLSTNAKIGIGLGIVVIAGIGIYFATRK